jgi:hypothetical protein
VKVPPGSAGRAGETFCSVPVSNGDIMLGDRAYEAPPA